MSTRMVKHIRATPSAVDAALIDGAAVQHWMVPNGMSSTVHEFDERQGGSFRITLTYDARTTTGKTDSQSDTFHGRLNRPRWPTSGRRSVLRPR